MTDLGKAFDDFARALIHQRHMTHSGIVIATAAILDVQLERALKRGMQPLSKGLYERLFDSFRPLSTFSSKIIMAYALGIVSVEIFEELEKIRRIRNAFAHSSEILNFSSPQIIPIFRSLRIPDTKETGTEAIFMACVKVIDNALEEYLARMEERSG